MRSHSFSGGLFLALLMAAWWMTEALPLAVTSLVPIVAFPLLGVLELSDATAPYASPTVFLFMGGFMIALAMQKWNLHKRIALLVMRAIGTKPRQLSLGVMIARAVVIVAAIVIFTARPGRIYVWQPDRPRWRRKAVARCRSNS